MDRVGIFGTSAGAYGAAHAMLAFPDFYKVGVAISGDHDARLDKAWWNELYQGYPVGEDYIAQSNVTMANRLQGRLLLEHGDIDDNVHPAETMRFADALMHAHKDFDMLLVLTCITARVDHTLPTWCGGAGIILCSICWVSRRLRILP